MANQVLTVANASELKTALSKASGGDTILLKAGNYGKVSIGNNFSSEVTIKSASANSMAKITELRVDGASNIKLDSILFDYNFKSGDKNFTNPFSVLNSDHITVSNSIFDGDTSGGSGFGKGLVMRNTTNVNVLDSEFHTWWKAVNISDSSDIQVSGNDVHSIRSDGLSFGTVKNLVIDSNHIHDFGGSVGSGDHRDMIQIQRSSGTASSNIVIRDNVLDIGAGDYTQGIWAGHDKANTGNSSHWHKNVLIENNVLYNAHANGIGFHLSDGLTIRDNTVLAVDVGISGGIAIPKILVSGGSKNVTIQNNVSEAIVGPAGQSDWKVSNNAYVQNKNPSAPGYYGDEFIVQATGAKDGYNSFGVKAGGIVDKLNAGSDLDLQISSGGSSKPSTPPQQPSNPTVPPVVTPPSTDNGSSKNDKDDDDAPKAPTPPASKEDDGKDSSGSKGSGNKSKQDRDEDSGFGRKGPPDQGSDKSEKQSDFFAKFFKLSKKDSKSKKDYAKKDDDDSNKSFDKGGKDDAKKGGFNKKSDSFDQFAFKKAFAKDKSDGGYGKKNADFSKADNWFRADNQKSKAQKDEKKFDKGFSIDNFISKNSDAKKLAIFVDQKADRLKVSVDDGNDQQHRKSVIDRDDSFNSDRSIGDVWARHSDKSDGGFNVHDYASYVENAQFDDDGQFF